MDGHHGIVVPEQGADLIGQIAQGVPVLRKDNEFFPLTIGGKHFAVVLQQLGKLVQNVGGNQHGDLPLPVQL